MIVSVIPALLIVFLPAILFGIHILVLRLSSKDKLSPEELQKLADDDILGKPIFDDMPDEAYKVRRNLIFTSALAVVIVFADLGINDSKPLYALPIKGLDINELCWIVLAITIYHLFHFLSHCSKFWTQWRIRLTASIGNAKTAARKCSHAYDALSHKGSFDEFYKNIENRLDHFEKCNNGSIVALSDVLSPPGVDTRINVNDIKDYFIRIKRFDNAFWLFQLKQRWHWVIFEACIPIGLGFLAILVLLLELQIISLPKWLAR